MSFFKILESIRIFFSIIVQPPYINKLYLLLNFIKMIANRSENVKFNKGVKYKNE